MQAKNREISPLGREEGYGGKDLEKGSGENYLPFLLRSGDAHRDLATITPKTQVVVRSRPSEMGALGIEP